MHNYIRLYVQIVILCIIAMIFFGATAYQIPEEVEPFITGILDFTFEALPSLFTNFGEHLDNAGKIINGLIEDFSSGRKGVPDTFNFIFEFIENIEVFFHELFDQVEESEILERSSEEIQKYLQEKN